MNQPAFVRRFRLTATLTIVAVYLLILVGGIVRSTGSGMGCPDWPKCFGQWVPPTEASQLPPNYKEVYTAQRVAKNQRVAGTLQKLGFKQVAADLFAHPTQYIDTDFNATKTWIEYVNRLLGALIGVFIFATVLAAWPFLRRDSLVFWAAFVSFITVGIQGWLGSLVVSTNLLPELVTIHMALALVLVALLEWALVRADKQGLGGESGAGIPKARGLAVVLATAALLTFGQILLGTQVREQIDMIAFGLNYLHREQWIAELGGAFKVHRTFSLVLLLINAYAAWQLYHSRNIRLQRLAVAIMVVIGLEIVAGVVLAYLAVPAAVQPVHLTLGTLLFGLQFLALIRYRQAVKVTRLERYPGVVA
ncbi:heme A synthase [Hymenobacter busanensis]|uniref:Heme A synthase n=1 Tax=Hymenobacter busanensis TaxID=2607656 RepID=A0A7L5A2B3_9BACT|nr:COX15/CtaA family protein [Hymenobacter busanensis]KAA9338263.1 heme A synthase [Hymenobacter busanensis]QHJ09313.1 heme A synthase [Hymenobacter busanensis]